MRDASGSRLLIDEKLRAAEAFETSAVYSGDGLDLDARRMEQEAQEAQVAAFAASLQQQEEQQVVWRAAVREHHPAQDDEATRLRSTHAWPSYSR